MRQSASSLGRDARGIAAVEFAFIAPVLILLICGTIELGYLYTAQTSLAGAVARAARQSATTQESSSQVRKEAMRALVERAMNSFPLAANQNAVIEVNAFHSFGDTHPEQYTDMNDNGRYDPPAPDYVGDPFTDRNGNGAWDAEVPYATDTVGEPGDVIRYSATYPVRHLFTFMTDAAGLRSGARITATAIVRNEPVKTQ
jgi:Flp pilus assembly protein TadG